MCICSELTVCEPRINADQSKGSADSPCPMCLYTMTRVILLPETTICCEWSGGGIIIGNSTLRVCTCVSVAGQCEAIKNFSYQATLL